MDPFNILPRDKQAKFDHFGCLGSLLCRPYCSGAALFLNLSPLAPVSLPLVGSIRAKSITEIGILWREREVIYCGGCETDHAYHEFMAFPLNTLHLFEYCTSLRKSE